MQKLNCLPLALLAASLLNLRAQVTPEQVLEAVDKMTPEQVKELDQKLKANLWRPVPRGFFTRMAGDIGLTSSRLDEPKVGDASPSGGALDVEDQQGAEMGLYWQVFDERTRIGFRVGGAESEDSNRSEAGFSRADLASGTVSIPLQYQLVRGKNWLVWAECAPGGGGITFDTVDTPRGSASTLRSYEGGFGFLDARAGVSYRFNRVLSVSLAGGYRFAEKVDWEEGGDKTGSSLDPSSAVVRWGLGANF